MDQKRDFSYADLQGADGNRLSCSGGDGIKANFLQANLPQANLCEADRLLAAAVVSNKFRQLLLTNSAEAIAAGWEDESFTFSPEERQGLLSIKARTLEEFARALITNWHSQE